MDDIRAAAVRVASQHEATFSCFNHAATGSHSGLAIAGRGDVLAGATAGIRARGVESVGAACQGVHLYTGADNLLTQSVGPVGYLAREIPDRFPQLLAHPRASGST